MTSAHKTHRVVIRSERSTRVYSGPPTLNRARCLDCAWVGRKHANTFRATYAAAGHGDVVAAQLTDGREWGEDTGRRTNW